MRALRALRLLAVCAACARTHDDLDDLDDLDVDALSRMPEVVVPTLLDDASVSPFSDYGSFAGARLLNEVMSLPSPPLPPATTTPPPSAGLDSGVAVWQGYVSNCDAYVDYDGDLTLDTDEPSAVTDGKGYYAMLHLREGRVRVGPVANSGGSSCTDSVMGRPLPTALVTTRDAHIASPLTSVGVAMIDRGLSRKSASATVCANLIPCVPTSSSGTFQAATDRDSSHFANEKCADVCSLRAGAEPIDLFSFDALYELVHGVPPDDPAWLSWIQAQHNIVWSLTCMEQALKCASSEIYGAGVPTGADCGGVLGGHSEAQVHAAMVDALATMAMQGVVELESNTDRELLEMVTRAAGALTNAPLHHENVYAANCSRATHNRYMGLTPPPSPPPPSQPPSQPPSPPSPPSPPPPPHIIVLLNDDSVPYEGNNQSIHVYAGVTYDIQYDGQHQLQDGSFAFWIPHNHDDGDHHHHHHHHHRARGRALGAYHGDLNDCKEAYADATGATGDLSVLTGGVISSSVATTTFASTGNFSLCVHTSANETEAHSHVLGASLIVAGLSGIAIVVMCLRSPTRASGKSDSVAAEKATAKVASRPPGGLFNIPRTRIVPYTAVQKCEGAVLGSQVPRCGVNRFL